MIVEWSAARYERLNARRLCQPKYGKQYKASNIFAENKQKA